MIAGGLTQAIPNLKIGAHFLPNTVGPMPGNGGRDWVNAPWGWWGDSNTGNWSNTQRLGALGFQFPLVNLPDETYRTKTREIADRLHALGRELWVVEYVRPNTNEDESRRIGQICLESGADAVLNGAW